MRSTPILGVFLQELTCLTLRRRIVAAELDERLIKRMVLLQNVSGGQRRGFHFCVGAHCVRSVRVVVSYALIIPLVSSLSRAYGQKI